ncbi:MAG: c-type cytochrome [Candidatus Promineifilaceae bacterium]
MKKTLLFLTIGVLAAMLLAACGGGEEAKEPEPAVSKGDVVAGEKNFQVCAACHGPDAKGLPNLGKDMTTSEFIKGLTDDELVEFIKTGRPIDDPANTTGVEMPAKGANPAFTDEDLYDIVAYIRTVID